MIAARSSACSSALPRRSSRSTLPPSSQATTTTFIPAITALAALVPCADGDQADVAPGVAPVAVVGADRQQPGELALRPGVRLQRHGVVPGDLGQPALEVPDHREVPGGLVERRERVHGGELRPGDRLHLGGGVELHRAGAERDHRAVEGEVPVGQPAQVAQHRGLVTVRGEDRDGERNDDGAPSGS